MTQGLRVDEHGVFPGGDDVLAMAIRALKKVYKAQHHPCALVITSHFLVRPARSVSCEVHPPIARTLKNLADFERQRQIMLVQPVKELVICSLYTHVPRLVDDLMTGREGDKAHRVPSKVRV